MTVGLAATTYADKVLNHMHRAVASTAPAANYVQLHTGDPGGAGTSNVASVTTRSAATFSASSGGAVALSNTPSWATWAGTNGQVISHISVWDASTTGTFLYSIALGSSKTMNTGDTLNLTTLAVSMAPIAA